MIISIDIGTSYSSASMLGADGKAHPIDIGTGVSIFGNNYSLPSAVFVENDGSILVGQAAMNKRQTNPSSFCMEFKRNLGENFPVQLGSLSLLPEDLYRELFYHIKKRAKEVSGEEIELAYLTCPASYSVARKKKVQDAAKSAGLFKTELVEEPTAAAMSYCAAGYIKEGDTLLVYDLGGGTFDAALLRYENQIFKLLAEPVGVERCGGIDMDRAVFQDVFSKVDQTILEHLQSNDSHYKRFIAQLTELAVKAKHHFSDYNSFEDNIQIGFDMLPYQLSREQFEQMIAPIVGKTIPSCRQLLEKANLSIEQVSAVLLVGGASRVPLVVGMVKQFAGETKVCCASDRDLAVAQGAINYREFNSAEAQYQRGLEYWSEKEYAQAVECYNRAAKQGHAGAQNNLGIVYYAGIGVVKDYGKAVEWYRKATDQNNISAQYNLGVCYLNGNGVPKDLSKAKMWFHKAAEQGDVNARSKLQEIEA